jgi:hypothetical protein
MRTSSRRHMGKSCLISAKTVDAISPNADADVATTQRLPTPRIVISLVRMELGRSLAPLLGGRRDRRDGIDSRCKDHRVVPVGAAQECGEGDSGAVDHPYCSPSRDASLARSDGR